MGKHITTVKKTALACAVAAASLSLTGCFGGSGGGSSSGGDDSTAFSVAVDDGQSGGSTAASIQQDWTNRIAALLFNQAHAAPVDQLGPSQFSVTIIGGAEDGSDLTLDPSEYTVEPLGNGEYEVVVPGNPRFDCYIATDVDGDGSVDLRAPTVANDIRVDPVSEYVTGILEENASNFANFSLEEVNAIVDQVQEQVDNNPDLQSQIEAVADDPDAVKTLLDDQTTVADQFEVAALPDPENTDNLAGDYQFLGQSHMLARTSFTASDSDTSSPGANFTMELVHFPASLSLDGDAVTLTTGNTETEFDSELTFTNTASEGLSFESGEFSEDSVTVPGAITSLGFNLNVGGDGPQTDGNETETQLESTFNFVDVTGSFKGFVSANEEKFDYEETSDNGTYTAAERGVPWFVMAKQRSSFDPSVLAGDWGMVLQETTIDAQGGVNNTSEALNFAIDSSGVFNFPGTEEFTFGYDTNVRDSSTLTTNGGFNLTTGTSESIPMNYSADGTFGFNDSEYTTFGSKGVVFAGDQMLALGLTGHEDATDNTADFADATMIFAVPKADSPKAALQGKTFFLTGRTYYNNATDAEVGKFGPVSLTFNNDATSASIKGVVNSFIVTTPADGTAEQLSETFSLSGFDVTISANGMVQLENSGTDETVELNGFISANGQNLVLTLVSEDTADVTGDTGMFVGRCTTNCQ